MCDVPVAPRSENRTFPFCSERCQTIDLGHWLDERYRIPTAEAPSDEDE
ncbi:MAG TPA: DNA gyrase inhibitor YacG [Kofleriaceae bacterium]|nr:DNA gyrase inhibitor YacG [Kofleriaceae bacterium]